MYYKEVTWKPSTISIKCNTDVACRGNLCRSSYDSFLRSAETNLIYYQWEEINEGKNTKVEVIAIKAVAANCVIQNINQICLETNFLLMKHILSDIWPISYQIKIIANDIKEFMQIYQVNIEHIYKEESCLANLAFDNERHLEFKKFLDLHSAGTKILNLDKAQ